MDELAAYGGLFLSALIAATIFPAQSEVVLVGLLLTGDYPWPGLFAAATVGNVLGSVVNWWIGLRLERLRHHPRLARRLLPGQAALDRAQRWFRHRGSWLLLLAWMPFIGDPLTVVAGILRVGLLRFVVLVTIGKAGRYLVLIAATLAAAGARE